MLTVIHWQQQILSSYNCIVSIKIYMPSGVLFLAMLPFLAILLNDLDKWCFLLALQ